MADLPAMPEKVMPEKAKQEKAKPDKQELRGRFITFEGVDGCGKTTQAARLANHLREVGLPVLMTREPGGTPIGDKIRSVLLNPDNTAMTPATELLLYLADRLQHLEQVIRPGLARGEVVICDRFHDATVAYQHHGRGLDLRPLEDFIAREILSASPDLTVWIDLDVREARGRIAERNQSGAGTEGESRMDAAALDFHQRVREGYAALHRSEPGRIERIEGQGSPEELQAKIQGIVEGRYHVR
jgi:dTMP kinase